MKAGLYKPKSKIASRRAGLFMKVFFATLVLAIGGYFVAPKAERLMMRFFPAVEDADLKGAAPEQVFKDVFVSNPNVAAIAALKNEEIIRGFDDGTFRPDDKIKREEFAKLVVLVTKANPHELSNSNCFSDVGNEWFAPYVCFAKRKQFVGGYEDGSFGTGKTITVSEGIALLNKTFRAGLTAGSRDEDAELTRGEAAGLLAKAMGLVR